MPTFSADKLRSLGIKIFKTAGATDEQAETVTEILVDTSLMGIDSHGVRALPGYVRNLMKGRMLPDGQTTVLKETLTTALWHFFSTSSHYGKVSMGNHACRNVKDDGVFIICWDADGDRIRAKSSLTSIIGCNPTPFARHAA